MTGRPRRLSKLLFERLEPRLLMASVWQNTNNPRDVDVSGLVNPLDVLLMVNQFNIGQGGLLPARPPDSHELLCDVNGDGLLTPLDVLLVVNALNRYNTPLQVSAGLSPVSDRNGNGIVLSSQVTYVGESAPEVHIGIRTLATQSVVLASTQSDAQGRFTLPLTLPAAANALRIEVLDPLGRITHIDTQVSVGDVILDWNATALNVVRQWTALPDDAELGRIGTSAPPMVARNLAMMHTAMFDAVNAMESTHASYLSGLPTPPTGASRVAAAAAAAHQVAVQLYSAPAELAAWQASLDEALNVVPEGDSKSEGIAWGRSVGNRMLAARLADGAQAIVDYLPGNQPGNWNRTLPNFNPPLLPQWPQVTPFALQSGDQFRPALPPELSDSAYAAAVDEVMRVGGLESSSRSPEQTDIALFWADGVGTFTPPGHWNQIAADVSIAQQSTFAENARLFALLNMALADAGISAWDAKYHYDLWRPIDAIRQAATDGNSATVADATWLPLLASPPFPTYTSGHSTFSAAAAAVLNVFFGDNFAFTSHGDKLAASHFAPRAFSNFDAAAAEAGLSRIYGGIHFSFDNTAGLAAGHMIGRFVVDHLLRPQSAKIG